MRRKDREISDLSKIHGIIRKCYCCRVGFNDCSEVYIVPLSFGFVEDKENGDTFYFHGAKEGRKVELIKKSNYVGFELDTNYKLNGGDFACDYSARFQSVIGNGVISIVTDENEKIKGLCAIMEQATGKKEWTFNSHMLQEVCVFKLVVQKISCKEHC